jgi:hypothetical protein
MTNDTTQDPDKTWIYDFWCPFPIEPQILSGVEDMHVLVTYDDEVAEHFFGEAGCEHLRGRIVEWLRFVGVDGDPQGMKDRPDYRVLIVTVNLKEDGEMLRLFVWAAFLNQVCAGYCRCFKLPGVIRKDNPQLMPMCATFALFLITDFMDSLLEQNPDRPDYRDDD